MEEVMPEALPCAEFRDDGTMTIVYRGLTREDAKRLMSDPKFSAGSWSHAMNDRDRLHAECESLRTQLQEQALQSLSTMGQDDATIADLRTQLAEARAEAEALRADALLKLAHDVEPFKAAELLRRAVANEAALYARSRFRIQPFWGAVRELTSLGSNCSAGLARWAGFDPETGTAMGAKEGE
jgi:hypothetical protein